MSQINYKELTWFTGRNGLFKSKGLMIDKTHEGHLWLSPMTSRGKIARCDIVIHKDSIDDLIDKLKHFKGNMT